MADRLAAVVSGIDDGSVALAKSLAPRNLCSNPMQMADKRAMSMGQIGNRADVFTRNNQYVQRRLRVDVRKNVALIVLIDSLRRDPSVDNLAKEAAHD